jgi:hypothetical protein
MKKVVVNCETGEVLFQQVSAEEVADLKKIADEDAKASLEAQQVAKEKADARQAGLAKLMALGLTESEALAIVD